MTVDQTSTEALEATAARVSAALAADPPDHLRRAMDDRMAHAIAGAAAAPPRGRTLWRRPRLRLSRMALAGISLVVLVGGAAGAASVILEHGSRAEDQRTPAQYNAEVREALGETPFPAGYRIPTLTVPVGEAVIRGSGAGKATVQRAAMCAWTHTWLDAHDSGDRATLHEATSTIGRFPDWMAVADTRHADPAIRASMVAMADAARDGQPGPLETYAASCLLSWPWP